jgi:hypothetical protein
MDELEISGKRYISAKRIAKENKYHPDYMGQLIRAGRISGTKVGRAWYVEEASLNVYLGKAGAAVAQAPASAASVVVTEVFQAPIMPEQNLLEKNFVPAGASLGAGGEEFSREKISAKALTSVQSSSTVKPAYRSTTYQKPTLTYVSDSSPLFPAIKKTPVEQRPIEVAQPVQQPVHRIAQQVEVDAEEEPKRSLLGPIVGGTALAIVGVAIFVFAFFGSVGYDTVVNIAKGQPASTAISQEKTFCFIFGECQK